MRMRLEKLFSMEELVYLGAALPETLLDHEKYEIWLASKRHAGMVYLEQNVEARKNAELILPGAKSALVFALPYYQESEGKELQYARYARFRDYHKILKEKGERLVYQLKQIAPGDYRVTVDSAPVLERALAAKTLEGFIGKNTCYIHPKYGSFLLLGEIFTTAVLDYDQPSKTEGCETCTLCQVECPTGALDSDYQMDARKCLAYWTIENRGTIPFEFWPYLKEFVFGCDLCQTVCPYNVNASNALPKSIAIREYPEIFQVATMNQSTYETVFGGTPVTRARREGLRRNALIAMAVSHHPRLEEALECIDSNGHEVLIETRNQIKQFLQKWRENPAYPLDGKGTLDTLSP